MTEHEAIFAAIRSADIVDVMIEFFGIINRSFTYAEQGQVMAASAKAARSGF